MCLGKSQRVEIKSIQPVSFKKKATYLITGGLGGLGLKVAAWMSRKGAGHLLLLSRKKLPLREEWEDLLPYHPASFFISAIKDIENSGAEVETLSIDVSDRTAMSDLFQRLKLETSAPLRGIIHAAVRRLPHFTRVNTGSVGGYDAGQSRRSPAVRSTKSRYRP